MDWTWYLLPGNLFSSSVALIFGLLFGSFLNVVIYRLPIMMVRQCENHLAQANGGVIPHRDTFNLALPDSFCESCHRPLACWENIPVISYLLLLGRCRTCHARISPRIPIVEAFAGLATASIVWFFGVSLFSAAVLFFFFSVLALALIDWDVRVLPDVIVFLLLWIGLLCSVYGLSVAPRDAVLGALAAYLALWLLRFIFCIRRPDAIGDGDLKFAAAIGVWIGVGTISWMFLIASVSAVFFVLVSILVRRSFIGLRTALPFGPFLGFAGVLLFFNKYLHFFIF